MGISVNLFPDFETILFYEGVYYDLDADLYDHGEYDMVEDGAGEETAEIYSSPEFYNLVFFTPDGEVVDNPDEEMCKYAQAVLEGIYWDRLLDNYYE